jgi:hypothetical protein
VHFCACIQLLYTTGVVLEYTTACIQLLYTTACIQLLYTTGVVLVDVKRICMEFCLQHVEVNKGGAIVLSFF